MNPDSLKIVHQLTTVEILWGVIILVLIAVGMLVAASIRYVCKKPTPPVMRPCGRFVCPLSWTACDYCTENPKNEKENPV